MTRTDMIIKYMGITSYFDMMEKEIQDKIAHCNSQINYFAMELAKLRSQKKKKRFTSEKIYEDDLNLYASELAKFQKSLENLRKMTHKLMKILDENTGKAEIPDDIFEGLFDLLPEDKGEGQ